MKFKEPLTYDSYIDKLIRLTKEKDTMQGTMREVLPNGMAFEGTPTQLLEVKRALGIFIADGKTYNSSTKGIIAISTMDSKYIRNAVRKSLAAKVTAMDTNATSHAFLNVLQNLVNNDPTLLGLVNELQTRND